MYVKKIIFGMLLHAVTKKEKNLAIITDDPATTCDEIIDAEAKSSNEKPKTFLIKVNEKK